MISLLITVRIRHVPPSGAKVRPVRRTFWISAAVPTVKASTRSDGQADRHLAAVAGVVDDVAHRVLDAREVGGRQRGQRHLVVARSARRPSRTMLADLGGGALADRPGDHARPGRSGSPGCSRGTPRR